MSADDELRDDLPDDAEETSADLPIEGDRSETDAEVPEMAYSATRFETLGCRFRFYGKYIAKWPEARSPVLGFGSFVHRVAELYLKKCVVAQVDGDGLLADEALEAAWTESPEVTPEQYEEVDDLIHWYAKTTPVPWNNVVGVELEYAVDRNWQPCGWNDPQVRLRGRVDQLQVYGALAVVVDEKTHRAALSQKQMERSWGTRLYAPLAWAHNQGLSRIQVVFEFMRQNIRRDVTFEISDILRLRDEADRAMDRVDALMVNRDDPDKWPASPSPQCGICSYVSICPAQAQVRALGVVTTPEAARQAAENILYLEEALKRNKQLLREWVKAMQAVPVNGVAFDYYRTAQWEFNTKAVIEACRTHGVPLEAVVKVDKKAIDRVIKTAARFGIDVARVMRDVGKTTFKWKKQGDG